MKKFFVMLCSVVMLISVAACNKQATDQLVSQEDNQITSQLSSSDSPEGSLKTDELDDQEESDKSIEQLTLEADNDYVIIDAIDISDCKWENGFFSGRMTFTSHTTQEYIDEYSDYIYRKIYFGFYNENGDLVGDTGVQNNCVYDRDYIREDSAYVLISSKYKITEVKVLRIVCETI